MEQEPKATMSSGHAVGYVRVSAADQHTDRQLDGVPLDMKFEDRASGKDTAGRPQLQACLLYLRPGDTLHVHSIDRLARSLQDLQSIVTDLTGRGVGVVFHQERLRFGPDRDANPVDQLLMQFLGAVAEFERALIRSRQREGIDKAKAAGKYKGRQSRLSASDLQIMQQMRADGLSLGLIGQRVGMTRQGVQAALRRVDRDAGPKVVRQNESKADIEAKPPVVDMSSIEVPAEIKAPAETPSAQTELEAVQQDKSMANIETKSPVIDMSSVVAPAEVPSAQTEPDAVQQNESKANIEAKPSVIDMSSVVAPAEVPSAQAEPDAVRQEDRVSEFVSDAMKKAKLRAEAEAVPETSAQRTLEEYWSAVKAASSIDTFPEPETYDEALYAIRQRVALWHVPKRLMTPELCAEAVQQCVDNLGDVPEALKTESLCMEALRIDPSALRYVPDRMKTEALCAECVRRNGLALSGVPEEWRTSELCAEAVRECGLALGYVPDALKTKELCMEAVKKYGLMLEKVPEKLRTPDVCRVAVQESGMALKYVPEVWRMPEMCRKAVKYWGRMLKDVPEELKTRALCHVAVKADGSALEFVPEEWRTPKICLEAVMAPRDKIVASALKWVPERLKTPALCLAAVKVDSAALEFVPEALRTSELLAVAQRGAVPAYSIVRRSERKQRGRVSRMPKWKGR